MRTASADVSKDEAVTKPRAVPPRHQAPLTARDRLLLADLVVLRYLNIKQIARLHFGHPKLAQRRMRKLHSLGLVVRTPVEGGARAGFHEWIYAAAPARRTIQPESDDPTRPSPLSDPSRGFRLRYAEHHRVLTDVRLWLREGAARPGADIQCRFLPGYAEMGREGRRRRFAAIEVGRQDGTLVPDGVFVLSRDQDSAALFFLEVDRGTEPLRGKHPSSVSRKLEMYRKVYDAGLYTPFSEHFEHDFSGFRVAIVAPDANRVSRILEVAASVDLAPLVWATTEATVLAPGNFSAEVWLDTPGGTARSLIE